MATQTEPLSTESSGALFRALRSAGVEPDLAYRADDEVRAQAGQNVITAIGAQITELKARIDAQSAELGTKIDALNGKIDSQSAELSAKIDAVNSRIDTLQRVIWPLVVLLASTVFGLLYRVFTVAAP